MEITDLKEGDKLYNLVYYNHPFIKSKRVIRQVTVKKVSGRKAYLKGGYAWTVTERMFNDTWFPTKMKAYEKALKLNQAEFTKIEENYKKFRREIKYLKKRINELNGGKHGTDPKKQGTD